MINVLSWGKTCKEIPCEAFQITPRTTFPSINFLQSSLQLWLVQTHIGPSRRPQNGQVWNRKKKVYRIIQVTWLLELVSYIPFTSLGLFPDPARLCFQSPTFLYQSCDFKEVPMTNSQITQLKADTSAQPADATDKILVALTGIHLWAVY